MAYSPKSQKDYNNKCEVVRIKYTPGQLNDYKRLQQYVIDNDIVVSTYIKGLIKADLDSKGIEYADADTED